MKIATQIQTMVLCACIRVLCFRTGIAPPPPPRAPSAALALLEVVELVRGGV